MQCSTKHFFKACAICGVLCISLPIPIIVNNFNKFYEKSKIEEEISMKKSKSFQNGSALNLNGWWTWINFTLILSPFRYRGLWLNMTVPPSNLHSIHLCISTYRRKLSGLKATRKPALVGINILPFSRINLHAMILIDK